MARPMLLDRGGVTLSTMYMLRDRRPKPNRDVSPSRPWLIVALLAVVLSVVLLWVWQHRAEKRAIQDLPDVERKALFARTLEDLTTVCSTERGADLSEHCHRQANFILQFPECDAACEKLAKRQLRGPTR